ncbi:hypothetical protein EXN66_Car008743 [Channa argus]|uniref:Uncharacterized protein n=1 Tax=Channa argus TaxID=215402 RepID=A0A6G1PS73_CHAAH|nr:hypothetical protein EXN66_Car008743 [Channa argus]
MRLISTRRWVGNLLNTFLHNGPAVAEIWEKAHTLTHNDKLTKVCSAQVTQRNAQ